MVSGVAPLSDRKFADMMNARSIATQMADSIRIAWFYIPISLGESLHTNLLTLNAVLTTEHPRRAELADQLTRFFASGETRRTFAVINLDQLLNLSTARSMEEILKECRLLALSFASLPLDRLLVHTGYIDASLKEVFTERNIFLVQKNLSDTKFALDFLYKLIPVFVPDIAVIGRNHLRILPDGELKVRVEFTRTSPPLHLSGSVADIGLGGLSATFPDEALAQFGLKDIVRLQIWLPRGGVRVTIGVVVWKKENMGRVGFFFDPGDRRMIAETEVETLSHYVHTRIKMARKAERQLVRA